MNAAPTTLEEVMFVLGMATNRGRAARRKAAGGTGTGETLGEARVLALDHVAYAASHVDSHHLREMAAYVMTAKPAAFAAEYSRTVAALVEAYLGE